MERAIGLLILVFLPVAVVTNLFRAAWFYLERVSKLVIYGFVLLTLGKRGADVIIDMEIKRLKKQSMNLWNRQERLIYLKGE